MSKTKWLVLLIVFVLLVMVAEAQKPAGLPGRAPMASHLLNPTPEWNAYYDVVPEGERKLYWTAKALVDVAREQQTNIRELDKRVKALEDAAKPKDPNGVK